MTDFDSLQRAWQTDADPPPALDADRLAALRGEAARFDRQIRQRDWFETAAALAVVVYVCVRLPGAGPGLDRVGLALLGLGSLFVAGWLWWAKRQAPAPAVDLPAADALRAAIARVDLQVRLLRSVAWWYLLPPAPGIVLMVAGPGGLPVAVRVAALAAVAVFFYGVYRLNQRTADGELVPLRDRLVRLLHDLTADA